MRKLCIALQIVVVLMLPLRSQAVVNDEIELIKTIEVPGNLLDKSGLAELLPSSTWHDLFGGISALEYTGKGNLYYALADRGPKDGAVDWSCRFHLVEIVFAEPSTPQFVVRKTSVLRQGDKVFSGLASRYQETDKKMFRFDPEGIRRSADGKLWIADEYGPHVAAFDTDGQWIESLKIPQRYKVKVPAETKAEENNQNKSGRQGNRGMEGLAINKTNGRFFGLMQSPLLQDCKRDSKNKPTGLNCRLIEIDPNSNRTNEFLYQLDHPKNKLNEILALSDNELLVIERDGKTGEEANFKKIMKISIAAATDIKSLERLPSIAIPENTVPVAKEVYIDLLDRKFGLSGKAMPEKIESLAFGPKLKDGRQTLLVVSDNDFIKEQPTYIYCFALKRSEHIQNSITTR